ncbi:MAG: phosphotransferase [Planctomycetaceae bacterium]|nr:phosphotransferase [Planctomycetaceae bacterium]
MTSTLSTQPTEEARRNSVIRRELRDGVAVYVKQSRTQDWEADADQVRRRCGHEADVIRRIADSGRFSGRLGRMDLIAAQPEEATLVTREVSGVPLQKLLLTSYRRNLSHESVRALFLAGRWLDAFQQLPVDEEDRAEVGDQSPHDLVEYCAIRLRKIASLGYKGINADDQRRLLSALRKCVDRSTAHDREPVLCHGDFGAFNVLWDSRVLTGIDFTQTHTAERLLDVTYFLHRLEMLPIYFPWKRWPIAAWERAFLRGYGRSEAPDSLMYQALMIRHWVCRLQTYVRRPRQGWKDRLHTPWVIHHIRRRLLQAVDAATVREDGVNGTQGSDR